LRYADAGSVTVADLCNVARVTQRTLEYAFREAFGLTPLGFIHLRRYQATQTDLLVAYSRSATVKEIAQSNGFYQMGRFAVRYRELFGESPSRTLNKPPAVLHCRLPRPRALGPL
jgi:AraC family ethanolamine operon transcriptional activator